MPESLVLTGMVVLGFLVLYAEIRLERHRAQKREERVAAEEQAIEAMRGGH